MDYSKLKEGLKALLTDSSSTEDVEKVTRLVTMAEEGEKEPWPGAAGQAGRGRAGGAFHEMERGPLEAE